MINKLDIGYFLELQRRFEQILLHVALHEDNFDTYSIKIENLFVDSCAFFDSLCQTFIVECKTSGMTFLNEGDIRYFDQKVQGEKYFNIDDYKLLLENDYHLSVYEINLNSHVDNSVGNPIYYIDGTNRVLNFNLIKPFASWAIPENPTWWKDYTSLKHNRLSNIKLGNLRNLTYSLAGTFILLTIKNEQIFKEALLDKEIYNVFFPNYWIVKSISTARSNILFK